MPTGYEDWIKYRTSDPTLALTRLQAHIQALMELASGGKTMADGVLFDPQSLESQLASNGFLMRELNRLEGVVNCIGIPRFQPTRRIDGGTFSAPDTGVAYSG